MIPLTPLILAEYHRPLFGNQWLALFAILGCVALLMVVVAAVGRWLAATHPDAPPRPAVSSAPASSAAAPVAPSGPSDEVLAIIAACVAVTFGNRARITSIKTGGPSVEMLMQQWSLEGRRQIYSSHQVR
jgi:hypothetical protein